MDRTARDRLRRWRKANPDRARVLNRRSRERHLEKRRAESRLYQNQHPEARRASQRRCRQRHPERNREEVRLWRKRNPIKANAITARRRARRRALPDTLTGEEAQQILAVGRCFYCGERFPPGELALEHLIPVSKGGGTTRANIVAACRSCNSRKNVKEVKEVLSQLAFT